MKKNYQQILDSTIADITAAGRVPKLLLHSCCAPCSTYVLEYLSRYFEITIFYFDPNIYPPEEFYKRRTEQERLIGEMTFMHPVSFIGTEHQSERFYDTVKGYEATGERGYRCYLCYELRLEETAKLAKERGYDFFTTTLSISPMKDAEWLNEIGGKLSDRYGVAYLYSDFKKRGGYKRSTELSKQYSIYRQDYCGCVFSMHERDQRAQRRSDDEDTQKDSGA
ncbi:MAG: epoxyqueuosine reductase QueH [Oscillospiraceae bacterium]|nr:epoxyqueuosine reductase QueH [Oscillospiraceae bacterium]